MRETDLTISQKELRECARYVAELDTRMEELNNEIQKYGKLSDKNKKIPVKRGVPRQWFTGAIMKKFMCNDNTLQRLS